MGKLSPILISVPLIVLPLLAATPPASAGLRPSDAVRLLAQSRTVDARCHYLAEADHQQLADYAARAEVAAAHLDGMPATRSALASGTEQGKAMACDDKARDIVTATLAAARQAEKALGLQPARLEKKATTRPASQPKVTALEQAPAKAASSLFSLSGSNGSLDLYTRHAAAYYIERRCGFLTANQTMAMWKLVVARHNAMIERHGGSAVTVAKAKAENAGATACGAEARVFVRAAWDDIQRYR